MHLDLLLANFEVKGLVLMTREHIRSRPDTFLDSISGGHNFQGPLSTWVFEYFGQIFVLFEIFELFEYLIE